MKNEVFIKIFVDGYGINCDNNGNLSVKRHAGIENVLHSYQTPIAGRIDSETMWVTNDKFSVTTSRHTNTIVRACAAIGIRVIRSSSFEDALNQREASRWQIVG